LKNLKALATELFTFEHSWITKAVPVIRRIKLWINLPDSTADCWAGEHPVSYFNPMVCEFTADCGSEDGAGVPVVPGAWRAACADAQFESRTLTSDQGLPVRS
jgi:hypothetical protein